MDRVLLDRTRLGDARHQLLGDEAGVAAIGAVLDQEVGRGGQHRDQRRDLEPVDQVGGVAGKVVLEMDATTGERVPPV